MQRGLERSYQLLQAISKYSARKKARKVRKLFEVLDVQGLQWPNIAPLTCYFWVFPRGSWRPLSARQPGLRCGALRVIL
ncbi:hypothetical protein NDU88_005761 [Pleurodeles waltl]|uniref:Uncharacterized protein n=1 Tax=Pleurodeles waltl TaxID=8319 RepID=A0AAV7W8X8_PLEWA|nr:hypothetical protein NDU88_005761 [Pleurodeles waltl]